MELLAYGVPIVLLLALLVYGVMRSGKLTAKEERNLDRNTEHAQKRDDPQK